MRTRIFILSEAGAALLSMDLHGDKDRVEKTIADNLALLATKGHANPYVIRVEPLQGADDILAHVMRPSGTRLEVRARPDGKREIVDLHQYEIDETGSIGKAHSAKVPKRIARSIHVIHAPADIANPRKRIRGMPA